MLTERRLKYISLISYSAQSRPPCVHSNTSPSVNITRKAVESIIGTIGLNENILEGRGNKSAISRSNRRNRIATRKNRKEKGIRADFSGSNPHS